MSDPYALINATRAAHDLHRLKRGALLEHYARVHSRSMARTETLEHGDLNGFLYQHHISWIWWGENVGATSADQPDPILALHKAYLASPPHKHNILMPRFRRIGIGSYTDERGITWSTQAFRA